MNLVTRGLLLLDGVMLVASAALAAPLAPVPNEQNGTISVIDIGSVPAVTNTLRLKCIEL